MIGFGMKAFLPAWRRCGSRLVMPLRNEWHACRKPSVRTQATGDSSSSKYPFIPDPTWSIESLKLNEEHPKLPPEELQRLAHRALLNVDRMPDGLEQDLANMMHMVEQVSDFVNENEELFSQYAKEDETGSFQYDFVRGVEAAPLRDNTLGDDAEAEEASRVWESYLEPNTIRQGGAHSYFSISTKGIPESSG